MKGPKLQMHFPRWTSICLLGSLLLALTIELTPLAIADDINPGVFGIDSQPYGMTYGRWSERWWQWAFQNTTFNPTTNSFNGCANESGPVWFLIAPANTSCVVPPNTAIMFPTFNVEWSVEEANAQANQPGTQGTCFVPTTPNGVAYVGLLACARAQANNATRPAAMLEADVDGTSLLSLTNYRAQSPAPPFTFTAAPGNIFGLPPGTSQSAADGFWIMLMPLSAGKHTVHFAATVPFPTVNPPATPFTFSVEASYCLIVQPSAKKCP